MSSMKTRLGISAVTLLACAAGAAAQDKYYLRSQNGDAWGQNGNDLAMDAAFGAGNWIEDAYETINFANVFDAGTELIYIDGGNGNANSFKAFVEGNIGAIENWVAAGGCLFLNAGTWYGVSIDTGFGGTSINGGAYQVQFDAINPAHPIFSGVPANFTGNSASHNSVTGGTPIANGELGQTSLAEFAWGSGGVLLGGLTDSNFWSPQPDAVTVRANMLMYVCRIPAPGAGALLGIGGLVALRRRR
jgi:hypothetical protein